MESIDKHKLAEETALEISDLKKGFDREEEMYFNRTSVCLYDETYSSVIIGFEARDKEVEELKLQVSDLQGQVEHLVQELSLVSEIEPVTCEHIRKSDSGMALLYCSKCGEYIYTGD